MLPYDYPAAAMTAINITLRLRSNSIMSDESPSIKRERSSSAPSSHSSKASRPNASASNDAAEGASNDSDDDYKMFQDPRAIKALIELGLDGFLGRLSQFNHLQTFADELQLAVPEILQSLLRGESAAKALLPVRDILDLHADRIWPIEGLRPWLSACTLAYSYDDAWDVANRYGLLVMAIVQVPLAALKRAQQPNPSDPQIDEIEAILKDFQRLVCADKYEFSRGWDEYSCFAQHRLGDTHLRVTNLDPRIWRADFNNKDRRVDGHKSWNEMVGDYFERLEAKGGDAWDVIDYMATTDPTIKNKPQDVFCIACAVGRPESELAESSMLRVRA